MRISYETVAAPGRPHNEDHVIAGPTWVAVLDGATAPAGVDSGCEHDVPWLVAQLGSALTHRLATRPGESLPDLVAAAIRATMAAHADTCDLTDPDSPSSTMAVLRRRDDLVDYLVLCDSPIALRRTDGTLTVVDDDRTGHLPGGRPYSLDLVRRSRNRPGGFWVASTEPEAAYEALSGSVEASTVSGALLLTDGVTRLMEWYGHPWEQLVDTAATDGPGELIRWVRREEQGRGAPSFAKRHDDATAAWISW
ncbi:protein phosphatase 2C domain-containing protein [Streptosporangium sp. NPDC050855]|uniref:protein phosphatase 2C domain-containing protein n=1 Tax=Streptosporangium sp. NPDC050855 TaxID=3366194 RepID=UPI00378ABD85